MHVSTFGMVAFLTMASASTAVAQTAAVDARWLPWIGCWRPAGVPSPTDVDGNGIRVCVVPAGDASARFLTLDGARSVEDEIIVPDGPSQTIDQPNCRGSRRSEWSSDGQRLYSSAELTCDNQSPRTLSGISVMAADANWVDVQVVAFDGKEQVRVRRYQRTTEQPPDPSLIPADVAARAAAAPHGSNLTVAHISEASGKVSPRVLEALLFETRTPFALNAKQLVALDNAGVSGSVIDLMVAFTFPKKFEVKRTTYSASPGLGPFDVGFEDPWSFAGDPFYSIGAPFGYYSRYGYYDTGYDYDPGDGVVVAPPPEPHGRVVNGSGYTQVVSRPSEATARSGGGSGGDASSSGGTSSSSSGSASSSGYSGGGGDSGRSAVPR